MKEFVLLELETSGLDPTRHELISLSALHLGKDCPRRFHTLLCPSVPIAELTERLTGLSNSSLAQAPTPEEAIRKFERWREGRPIVLCRPEFDLPFLTAAYQKAGLDLRPGYIHGSEEDRVRSLLWKYFFFKDEKSEPEKAPHRHSAPARGPYRG